MGSISGAIGALWGCVGVSLILGRGLASLFPHVRDLAGVELEWFHWVVMAAWSVLMAYSEGYRGFQLKFAPRVAVRAFYLKGHPTTVRVILAPLFCMGYFYATRRRKLLTYSLTGGIVGLIIVCGKLAQPWRGLVDVGVLIGLGWGMISVWIFMAKAFLGPGTAARTESLEQLSE
ncbi:MAG: hypothetical protein HQ523_05395 [Lentisphaerae bacterium]|nr:hypothetical protein [Lentisphaerota bacterium]